MVLNTLKASLYTDYSVSYMPLLENHYEIKTLLKLKKTTLKWRVFPTFIREKRPFKGKTY